MQIVHSINKIPIRIPKERWGHVVSGHPEMEQFKNEVLETLGDPDLIFEGSEGEKIAVKDYLSK